MPMPPVDLTDVKVESEPPARRTGSLLRAPAQPHIAVAGLAVPGVGRVEPAVERPFAVVRNRDDIEIPILSLALNSLIGIAPTTYLAYANASLRLCRFLWAIDSDPETLTRREYLAFRRWLDHCQQLPTTMPPPKRHDPARFTDITGHIESSTAAQAVAAIRSLYQALEDNEHIEVSPIPAAAGRAAMRGSNPLDRPDHGRGGAHCPGADRPFPQKRSRRQPLLPDLVEHLLADPTPRGRAMWRFMSESGPRINEVLTMQPERMFLDENYVDVLGKGLGGATRWVPISDAAVEAFREYQDDLSSKGVHLLAGQPVWRSLRRPYGPISYHGIRYTLATRLALADPRPCSPHVLRHTAATAMLVDLGMPVERVQKVLGHALLSSTQGYLHADDATATQAFTHAWRTGRTRPDLDMTGLYNDNDIADFLGALDD